MCKPPVPGRLDDAIVVVMKVSELKADMDAAFTQVDEQFEQVDEQFKQVHEQFEQVDERFRQVDERFEQVDRRFDSIETRLDVMDRRITDEARTTRRHFDVVAEDLKSQLKAVADASAQSERRLASITSESVTLLSALSDHELRLRVLEGTRGSTR